MRGFPAIGIAALLSSAQISNAGSFTWDASGTNPEAPTGGTGTWNASAAKWSNGVSDVAWPNVAGNNDQAIFSGAAGTVTLGSSLTAGGLFFNTSGYVLSGSQTLTLNPQTAGSGIGLASGVSNVSIDLTGNGGIVLTSAGTGTAAQFTNTDLVNFNSTPVMFGASRSLSITNSVATGVTTIGAFYDSNSSATNGGRNGTILGSGNVTINSLGGAFVNGAAVALGSTSAVSLTYAGTGVLTLNGDNTTFHTTGAGGSLAFVLSSGTLALGHDNALGAVNGSNAGTGTVLSLRGGTLQATSARNIANATSLDANSTIGGTEDLALSGSVTQTTNNTLTINNTGLTTLSGPLFLSSDNTTAGRDLKLTGSGSVLISGNILNNNVGNTMAAKLTTLAGFTGTLTLSGSNSYSGQTTFSGGKINLNSAEALGTNTAQFGSVVLDNTSGSAIVLAANNSLVFSGDSTFTGTNDLNLGKGAVTLSGGTRNLTINGGNLAIGGSIGDGGSNYGLTKSGAGTLTLSGSSTYTGKTTLKAGTLALGHDSALGKGVLSLSGGAIQATSARTVANTVTLDGDSTVTGAGDLTFSGSMTVAGGAHGLTVNNTGVTTFSGPLYLSDNNLTTGRGLEFGGAGAIAITGNILNNSGGNTVATSLATNETFTGQLTLTGFNSYSGATMINGGVLSTNRLADGGSLSGIGQSSSLASNLVIDGGTLQYTGDAASTDRLFSIGTNGGTLDASGSGAVNFSGTGEMGFNGQTGARTLRLTGANVGDNILAMLIGDNGGATSLVKDGAGTWVLAGNNSFTGSVTIHNGVLSVGTLAANGSAQSLGAGSIVNLGGSATTGTLNYTGSGGELSQNIMVGAGKGVVRNSGMGLLTLSGTLSKADTALTLSGGAFSVTGRITGGMTTDAEGGFNVGPNATVTISPTDDANDYTGPTNIFGNSALLNGTDDALPVGTVVNLGSEADGLVTNSYSLNGHNQSIGALNSVSSGLNTNVVDNGAGGGGTSNLTLTGKNADGMSVNSNFAGSIRDGGSGALALTITGGTHTLSGANNYTGATTVKDGALNLKGVFSNTILMIGSENASGLVPTLTGGIGADGGILATPLNGASLKVYSPDDTVGNVTGSVVIGGAEAGASAGHLFAADADVATFQFGDLTLNEGSILNWQFNESVNSFVNVLGALTIGGGGVSLYNEGAITPFAANGTYDLFQYGTLFGSLSNLTVLNASAAYSYTFGTSTVSGINYVTLTIADAIPEPSSWMMMLSVVGMVFGVQRFRQTRRATGFSLS